MPIDAEKSKRNMPDDTDRMNNILDSLERIGSSVTDCQELAISMGEDKGYNRAVAGSLARFIDLFEKGCKVPMIVENIAFHAEIRGRMSERLRLTLEMDSLKYLINRGLDKRSMLEKLLARFTRKGEKK